MVQFTYFLHSSVNVAILKVRMHESLSEIMTNDQFSYGGMVALIFPSAFSLLNS
jgi:hypothetical protein